MSKTKIEWADRVFNPVTGCTKISAGCKNCYAERMSKRLAGRAGYPKENPFKVTFHPERLEEPLRWKKPSRIFVSSMGDLFHDEVEWKYLDEIFGKIALAEHHTFLILTKRPERMCQFMKGWGNPSVDFPNLWLGVSVEDQATADERIPLLLQTPAAKRFVSYEPALGPINFRAIQVAGGVTDSFGGWHKEGGPQIDQIICGGESGPKARPMHPDWARSVRDQCKTAGIPFFFKQNGEWAETQCVPGGDLGGDMKRDLVRIVKSVGENDGHFRPDDVLMRRVGKKAAGCLLDGREHKEIPR